MMREMAESAFDLRALSQFAPAFAADAPEWSLRELAGRLVEISDPQPAASLSFAFLLVRETQMQKDCAAWVGCAQGSFHPPDARDFGIDLRNLPVLRMARCQDACRAAETLLRSGAFRLVVLDLGTVSHVSSATQARMHALVRQHQACVLFLTEKKHERQSIGPLVSLRACTSRSQVETDRFLCELHVTRDKRRGAGWNWQQVFSGIDGYR